MSTIGKIAVILALVGGLAALVLDMFLLKPRQEQVRNELADTKHTLDSTQKTLDTTKKDLASTKSTLESTKTELDTAKSDLETAKTAQQTAETKASEAEAKAADLVKQMAAKDEQIAKIEEEKKAAGASIPELKGKVDELTQQVAVIEGEKQTLTDKVKQQEGEIAQLKGSDGKVVLPTGLKGKVLVFEKNWNFVVIDIGKKDGAIANGELTVYRNTKLIGKVKLTSAINTHYAIADVLPQWSQMEIKEGDMVIPAT